MRISDWSSDVCSSDLNAMTLREYVDIRDFLVLHYNATERDDTPSWDYCRNLAPPEGLKAKLEMFRASGRIFREHDESVNETRWLSVMAGQGIEAAGCPDRKRIGEGKRVVVRVARGGGRIMNKT